MGLDTFTHGVYGVVLDEEDQREVAVLAEAARKKIVADGEDEEDDEDAEKIEDAVENALDRDPIRRRLVAKYRAPADATLHYSGGDDGRVGRANTDADLWLLGYGAYSLHERPPIVWEGADYHTWVTGG